MRDFPAVSWEITLLININCIHLGYFPVFFQYFAIFRLNLIEKSIISRVLRDFANYLIRKKSFSLKNYPDSPISLKYYPVPNEKTISKQSPIFRAKTRLSTTFSIKVPVFFSFSLTSLSYSRNFAENMAFSSKKPTKSHAFVPFRRKILRRFRQTSTQKQKIAKKPASFAGNFAEFMVFSLKLALFPGSARKVQKTAQIYREKTEENRVFSLNPENSSFFFIFMGLRIKFYIIYQKNTGKAEFGRFSCEFAAIR